MASGSRWMSDARFLKASTITWLTSLMIGASASTAFVVADIRPSIRADLDLTLGDVLDHLGDAAVVAGSTAVVLGQRRLDVRFAGDAELDVAVQRMPEAVDGVDVGRVGDRDDHGAGIALAHRDGVELLGDMAGEQADDVVGQPEVGEVHGLDAEIGGLGHRRRWPARVEPLFDHGVEHAFARRFRLGATGLHLLVGQETHVEHRIDEIIVFGCHSCPFPAHGVHACRHNARGQVRES